jgi:hypothetical protein
MLNAEWLDAAAADQDQVAFAAAALAAFAAAALAAFAAAALVAFAAAALAAFGPWGPRVDFVALALPAPGFGRWALVFEPWPLVDLDPSVQVFAHSRLRPV